MAGNARQRMRGNMDEVLQAKKDVLSLYGGSLERFKEDNMGRIGKEGLNVAITPPGRWDMSAAQGGLVHGRFEGWIKEREKEKAMGFFPDDPKEKAAFERVMKTYEAIPREHSMAGFPRGDYEDLRGYGRPTPGKGYHGSGTTPDYWVNQEKKIAERHRTGRIGDHDYVRAAHDDPYLYKTGIGRQVQYEIDPRGEGIPRDPGLTPFLPRSDYLLRTEQGDGEFDLVKPWRNDPSYWQHGMESSRPYELRASFPQDAPMPFSDAPYSSEPMPLKDSQPGGAMPRYMNEEEHWYQARQQKQSLPR